MKRIKILYITRVTKGGVAVVLDQLAQRLDRDQFEPVVLFDTGQPSDIRNKIDRSRIQTIHLRPVSHEPESLLPPPSEKHPSVSDRIEALLGKRALGIYLSLKSLVEFLRRQAPRILCFYRIIRRNGIHLVHAHSDIGQARAEIVAAWLARVPCVCHMHSHAEPTGFDLVIARLASSFVFISNQQATYLISRGIPDEKARVIHNGVDLENYVPRHDPVGVFKEFNMQPGHPVVCLVGRIDWWKGHEYFIEAISELSAKIPTLKGMIIGGTAKLSRPRNQRYLNRLHAMVKTGALDDKIIFTGHRKDVPRLISAMDVVVHASTEPEPFGLVVIEGMAAGKPVIATAAGGVLDIIEDGVSGVLVPCGDARALAGAVGRLLDNPLEAARLGRAARQRVAELFTVEHQLIRMQNLYRALVR